MSVNNDKTNLDLLEEDDEFEEFPCDGTRHCFDSFL